MSYDPNETGLYAPHYYSAFRCIADKCRHSCCIGWDIYIDDETMEVYRGIPEIHTTVTEREDGPCFAMREDGRCPHLNDRGLCNIILTHGEAALSEICTQHPRFYNRVGGRLEVGLGPVCEEACRLILESEGPFVLSRIGEADGEMCDAGAYDPLPERERIFEMIEADGSSYDEVAARLSAVFGIPDPYTPDEWLDRLLSLEILDADWARTLSEMRGKLFRRGRACDAASDAGYGRLLSYFVYRHVSPAADDIDLRARLGFALFSVGVIRSLQEAGAEGGNLADLARRYSAEIEYSEDNTAELIYAFTGAILRAGRQ